jgi:hypothetical protein
MRLKKFIIENVTDILVRFKYQHTYLHFTAPTQTQGAKTFCQLAASSTNKKKTKQGSIWLIENCSKMYLKRLIKLLATLGSLLICVYFLSRLNYSFRLPYRNKLIEGSSEKVYRALKIRFKYFCSKLSVVLKNTFVLNYNKHF